MNLTLVITTSPLFHLGLEGPDHQEEIGRKHPADEVGDVEGDVDLPEIEDAEDVEDEADCSQADPGPHEADVPLKYNKYKVMLLGVPSSKDSAVMKLGLDVQTNLTVLAPWIRQAETTVEKSDATSTAMP